MPNNLDATGGRPQRLKEVAAFLIALAAVATAAYVLGHESGDRNGRAAEAADARARPPAPLTYQEQQETQLRLFELWSAHDSEGDVRSPFYFTAVANLHKRLALEGLSSLSGTRIVEIGPGSTMIPGVLFVSAGAEHYYGADIFRHPALLDALPYRTALGFAILDPDYLVRPAAEILMGEEKGQAVLNPRHITFLQRQSYDLGLEDSSIDLVFSQATLEHIDEPLRSVKEWKRILKPGGVTAHVAFCFDHRDVTKTYGHLELDPVTWRAGFGPGKASPAHEFVNQWRPIDFRRAFEAEGFEIIEYSTKPRTAYSREFWSKFHPAPFKVSDADWERIAPSVREGHTREEVGEVFVTLVARKPALPKR